MLVLRFPADRGYHRRISFRGPLLSIGRSTESRNSSSHAISNQRTHHSGSTRATATSSKQFLTRPILVDHRTATTADLPVRRSKRQSQVSTTRFYSSPTGRGGKRTRTRNEKSRQSLHSLVCWPYRRSCGMNAPPKMPVDDWRNEPAVLVHVRLMYATVGNGW